MIELAKEYLMNNFQEKFEQIGSKNPTSNADKPLSEAKKQKLFL